MSSHLDSVTGIRQTNKPLPQIPEKKSIYKGREIEKISNLSNKNASLQKSQKIRSEINKNNLHLNNNQAKDVVKVSSSFSGDKVAIDPEFLRNGENKAVILPDDFAGRIEDLDINNLPIGSKIVQVVPMTDEDKKEIEKMYLEFYTAQFNLSQAQQRKKQTEELLAQRLDEENRETIKILLAKQVFNIDLITVVESFSQTDLNKIKCDRNKKCLTIDKFGMKSVIIPFLKKHQIKTIDLRVFKNEINEAALSELLAAIPETNVERVVLSKLRKEIMSDDELKLIFYAKEALKSRNFKVDLG